jgi:CYTH domain-containing protein
MATEIERKFRVEGEAWRQHVGTGKIYRQGYLSTDAERRGM